MTSVLLREETWGEGCVKIKADSWALVAHAYNPSYPGGRDQEDCGSKPAPGK
jgi:hypothetical protein